MAGFELFLCIFLGALGGSIVVLGAYMLGEMSASKTVGYLPSDLDLKSFQMARSLLKDIHEHALESEETELYSVDGSRYYETHEIPFCVNAIDKLIKKANK